MRTPATIPTPSQREHATAIGRSYLKAATLGTKEQPSTNETFQNPNGTWYASSKDERGRTRYVSLRTKDREVADEICPRSGAATDWRLGKQLEFLLTLR
jgi:hypothetical protein